MVDFNQEIVKGLLTFGLLAITGGGIFGVTQVTELVTGENIIELASEEITTTASTVFNDYFSWLDSAYETGRLFFFTALSFLGFFSILISIMLFFVSEPLMTILMYEGLVISYVVHKANTDPTIYGVKIIGEFMYHQLLLIEILIKIGEFFVNVAHRLLTLIVERIPIIG